MLATRFIEIPKKKCEQNRFHTSFFADIFYHCVCLRVKAYEKIHSWIFFYSYYRIQEWNQFNSVKRYQKWRIIDKKKCYSILNSIFTTYRIIWTLLLKEANSITANTVYYTTSNVIYNNGCRNVGVVNKWDLGVRRLNSATDLIESCTSKHRILNRFDYIYFVYRLTHMPTWWSGSLSRIEQSYDLTHHFHEMSDNDSNLFQKITSYHTNIPMETHQQSIFDIWIKFRSTRFLSLSFSIALLAHW